MKKIALLSVIICGISVVSCSDKNNISDAYGNFEAVEVLVSAESNGKIMEFNVIEGQILNRGDTLGYLDSMQLHLQKEQLYARQNSIRSQVDGVNAQIEVYREQKKNLLTEKARLEKLLTDGAATTKQMDDLNGQLNVLESQIRATETKFLTISAEMKSVETQIDLIDDQISRCLIINPATGTVLEKYVEPYEMAIAGRTLYKIADLREMILRVYITGDRLPELTPGQKVRVLIDKDKKTNQELTGTISWISDKSEFTPKIIQTKEERVNLVYAVKVLVPNDGRLKIGMPGEIRID